MRPSALLPLQVARLLARVRLALAELRLMQVRHTGRRPSACHCAHNSPHLLRSPGRLLGLLPAAVQLVRGWKPL
jgi:hypothetical protein